MRKNIPESALEELMEGSGLTFLSTFARPDFYSISSHVDSKNCDYQQYRECPSLCLGAHFSTHRVEIRTGNLNQWSSLSTNDQEQGSALPLLIRVQSLVFGGSTLGSSSITVSLSFCKQGHGVSGLEEKHVMLHPSYISWTACGGHTL